MTPSSLGAELVGGPCGRSRMHKLDSGFLVIDKIEGLTSHDVVEEVRRLLRQRRVGHLGTLDPLATGVLPVAFGKATRLIQFLSGGHKVYQGTFHLGFSTDTYDREGQPISSPVEPAFSPETLDQVARDMVGEQWQLPPSYSAKKVGGVRAYQLARSGKAPELTRHRVWIHVLRLERLSSLQLGFEIHCSSGTYVRSVAHEIGLRLGCGAHVASLRRLASGEFSLEQAVDLATLRSGGLASLQYYAIPLGRVLRELPQLVIDPGVQSSLVHGREFPARLHLALPPRSLVRVFAEDGQLLGLAEVVEAPSTTNAGDPGIQHLHPRVVLIEG